MLCSLEERRERKDDCNLRRPSGRTPRFSLRVQCYKTTFGIKKDHNVQLKYMEVCLLVCAMCPSQYLSIV